MQKTALLLILFLVMPAIECYAETSGIKTHKNLAPDLYEVLHRLEDNTSEIRTLKTEFVQEKELFAIPHLWQTIKERTKRQ